MKNTNEKLLDVFIREGINACPPRFWRPAADMYCCDNVWIIKLELAGVKQEDIQLISEGKNLCVRGLRRDLSIQHMAHYKDKFIDSLEIEYNRFERLFEMPFDIELTGIHTEYQDGMLVINLKPGETLQ